MKGPWNDKHEVARSALRVPCGNQVDGLPLARQTEAVVKEISSARGQNGTAPPANVRVIKFLLDEIEELSKKAL